MCRYAPRLVASQANSLQNAQNKAKDKLKCIKILSQNVQGIKKSSHIEELIHSFNRRKLFAACLQETWRTGNEQFEQDGVRVIAAGLEEQTGRGSQGVAIILGPESLECWRAAGYELHTDFGARVIAVRLLLNDKKNNEIGMFLISAYAPVGKDDDVIWEDYFRTHVLPRKQVTSY